jgi:hypothetical protein
VRRQVFSSEASVAAGSACHEKMSRTSGENTAVSADRRVEQLRKRIIFNRSWFPEPVRSATLPYDERSVAIRGEKRDAAQFTKSPSCRAHLLRSKAESTSFLLVGTS